MTDAERAASDHRTRKWNAENPDRRAVLDTDRVTFIAEDGYQCTIIGRQMVAVQSLAKFVRLKKFKARKREVASKPTVLVWTPPPGWDFYGTELDAEHASALADVLEKKEATLPTDFLVCISCIGVSEASIRHSVKVVVPVLRRGAVEIVWAEETAGGLVPFYPPRQQFDFWPKHESR